MGYVTVAYRPVEDMRQVARVAAKCAVTAALQRRRELTDAEIDMLVKETMKHVLDYMDILHARDHSTHH
jgi:hypothetical protein